MVLSTHVEKGNILQLLWTSDGSALASESRACWSQLTGQEEEVERAWQWLRSVHSEDRKRVRHAWREAASNANQVIIRYRLQDGEKSEQRVIMLCIPLLREADQLEGWVSWVLYTEGEVTPLAASPLVSEMLPPNNIAVQAPLAMACVSLDRYIIEANERYCQLAGYAHRELIGQRLNTVLSPAHLQRTINLNLSQMLMGHLQHLTYEITHSRPDGKNFWIKVTITLVWHAQGFPLHFFIWIEDLTLQRQLEQEHDAILAREQLTHAALQQSQQEAAALGNMLHTVFHTTVDGLIILDTAEKVQQINKGARTLLEFGAEEQCLGKPFAELFHGYTFYDVHDGAMRHVPKHQLALLHMPKGNVVSKSRIPNQLVRFPSGRECYLDVTLTPLFDQQGCLTSVVALLRDVTSLHDQELRIRKAFHTLSHVMDAMMALPLHTEQSTNEKCFAAATLINVGQRLCEVLYQMLDCTMASIIVLEDTEAHMRLAGICGRAQDIRARIQQDMEGATLLDYLDEGTIAQLRAKQVVIRNLSTQPFVRRPSYGIRNFLLAPLLREGQLIGLFGIDRSPERQCSREEITLVKALAHMVALMLERVNLLHAWAQTRTNELALNEVNHRFDTFLSLASHELRTPLTGIRGNVELVLRRMKALLRQETLPQITDETLQRLRQPLEEAVQRAVAQDRMISDLLDVSRIRANQLEMRMLPANLRDIVHQTVQDIHYLAPKRVIKLHESPEEVLAVTADADRIGQVVSNYLTNALKYSAPDQPVEIWLTKESQVIRVSVRDQGPGLSPQEQQAIWERFHRAKGIEVQYGAGGGLGLGLYLCRTIIEQHEGQVGVHSSKGEGSTFWFTLPLPSNHF